MASIPVHTEVLSFSSWVITMQKVVPSFSPFTLWLLPESPSENSGSACHPSSCFPLLHCLKWPQIPTKSIPQAFRSPLPTPSHQEPKLHWAIWFITASQSLWVLLLLVAPGSFQIVDTFWGCQVEDQECTCQVSSVHSQQSKPAAAGQVELHRLWYGSGQWRPTPSTAPSGIYVSVYCFRVPNDCQHTSSPGMHNFMTTMACQLNLHACLWQLCLL